MTFRIAQISDTHLSDKKPFFVDNFVRIGEALRADRPDLVLNSGDIIARRRVERERSRGGARLHDALDLPVRFLPGNHDLGDCQDAPSHGEAPIDAERRARYVAHFGTDWWTLRRAGLAGARDQRAAAGQRSCRGRRRRTRRSPRRRAAWTPQARALPAQAVVRPGRRRDRDHRPFRQSRTASLAVRRSLGGVVPTLVACGHVHQYRSDRGRRARVTSGERRQRSSCPTACSRATALKEVGYVEHRWSPTARMTAAWCRWPACRLSTSPIFPERTGRSDRSGRLTCQTGIFGRYGARKFARRAQEFGSHT